MPDKSQSIEESVVSTSDPGERLRDEHYSIDRFVVGVANIVAWIFPILMIAIVSQVVLRKLGNNQAWLDDAQWWLYGFAMLTGFAYAITTDSHVRVDIFHQNYSDTKKAKLEIFGIGWLLLPFIGIMIDIMTQYALSSWISKEGSDSPNGLHRLYILKISLPILFVLAALASLSMVRRNLKKFTTPTMLKCLLGVLPFALFVLDRLMYWLFYMYTRVSQPDLAARKIAKEPVMEYTTIIALTVLVIILIVLWVFGRNERKVV